MRNWQNMEAHIQRSELRGRISAPSSKSYTIRGLIAAALAPGESDVIRPLASDDTAAASSVLQKIGVSLSEDEAFWRVRGGSFHASPTPLHCRESATTLRLMTAVAALVPGVSILTSAPSLARRPITPLLAALRQLGVECENESEASRITVRGGRLRGGKTSLPGNISSQFVSALLLIAPAAEKAVRIEVTTPLESVPYVAMTLECLRAFGVEIQHSADMRSFTASPQPYHPTRYEVEGDWSSASYPLALGAVGGDVEVAGLNPASLQADRAILDYLKEMGAKIKTDARSVKVERVRLKGIKADLTDCPDLLPTVAVLAALAEGTSEFTGIARTRLKESDRVAALRKGLESAGARVSEETNRLTITGPVRGGATIDSYNDHRIAMAFSLLGVTAGNVTITGAECVAKTYPGFWRDLRRLGGKVTLDGE